jgi:hypothetical protein
VVRYFIEGQVGFLPFKEIMITVLNIIRRWGTRVAHGKRWWGVQEGSGDGKMHTQAIGVQRKCHV